MGYEKKKKKTEVYKASEVWGGGRELGYRVKPARMTMDDIKDKNSADHIESVEPGEAKKVPDLDDLNAIPIGWFVWVVALTASIAGLLFGYDTGVISAVLVYIGTDLDNKSLQQSEKEMITALCSTGAFFGAICAGLASDKVCLLLLYVYQISVDDCDRLAGRPRSISDPPCSPSELFCKVPLTPSPRWLSDDSWLDWELGLQPWWSRCMWPNWLRPRHEDD